MTTTLITGANKGLGYETARRLLEEGHDVWVAARDPELGSAAAERLGARFVVLDVRDEESVAGAVRALTEAGGLDVLVNNAGIVGPRTSVPETTAEGIAEVFDTNLLGPVRMVQAFTEQRGRSRLYGHRPERPQRHPDGRGRHRRDRGACLPGPRRADGRLHRPQRRGAVVS
jgi:NAD(P)-dependent dehydrogenase (short-subunit alcohol dehydrogenase family)